MKKLQKDISQFMSACGQELPDSPSLPADEVRALRRSLLAEEVEEYAEAEDDDDLAGIADAIGDIVYIAVGTAAAYGIDMEPIWNEIQRSNMDKIDKSTGKVSRRADGKILKPSNWRGPDIEGELRKQGLK